VQIVQIVRSHDQSFITLRENCLDGKTNIPMACPMYRFNIIVACSPLSSLVYRFSNGTRRDNSCAERCIAVTFATLMVRLRVAALACCPFCRINPSLLKSTVVSRNNSLINVRQRETKETRSQGIAALSARIMAKNKNQAAAFRFHHCGGCLEITHGHDTSWCW